MQKPLLILDRDGVINVDSPNYIKSLADWRPIPGSYEAITKLTQAGFIITVASNQSALSRGMTQLADVTSIHQQLNQALAELGGHIHAFAICPHLPEHHCACRKPKPGLLWQLAHDFGVTPKACVVIGDSARDMAAAEAFGAKETYWVKTGNPVTPEEHPQAVVADDLAAVAALLLKE